MATMSNITDGFHQLGFRIDADTIVALLKDATKR